MKPKKHICPICRKQIAIDEETLKEFRAMAKDLAKNFFFIRYKGIKLYCCDPGDDYKWGLRYRGIIPIRMALRTNQVLQDKKI